MKFNFFSSTTQQTAAVGQTQSDSGDEQTDIERAALTRALYDVLEELPQAFKGGDHLKRVCETILQATPRLRLVWIGFCSNQDQKVSPHAALGECVPESKDWDLPKACFDFASPYSQIALESVGALNDLNSLFSPWHANMGACTVNCALAIPLRSEKTEARGLVVFYADDVNYFSRLGIPPFQAFCHVAEIIWKQSSLVQILTQKAQLDGLTGLMNRRKMTQMLHKAIERASQEIELLSIMILRIEGFERINELHGWNAADNLLASFSREIMLQMRSHDRVGRWTGVEFLYILPRTDLHHAEYLAHGLQAYFRGHPLSINNTPIHLGLRVGVATFPKQAKDFEDLLKAAYLQLQAPTSAASMPK